MKAHRMPMPYGNGTMPYGAPGCLPPQSSMPTSNVSWPAGPSMCHSSAQVIRNDGSHNQQLHFPSCACCQDSRMLRPGMHPSREMLLSHRQPFFPGHGTAKQMMQYSSQQGSMGYSYGIPRDAVPSQLRPDGSFYVSRPDFPHGDASVTLGDRARLMARNTNESSIHSQLPVDQSSGHPAMSLAQQSVMPSSVPTSMTSYPMRNYPPVSVSQTTANAFARPLPPHGTASQIPPPPPPHPSSIPPSHPSMPPSHSSSLPSSHPSSLPPTHPANIPPTHPSPIPPSHSSSLPPTHPSSLPPTHPSSLPPTHPSSLPPTHPSSLPPTHPSSMPPSHPSSMPSSHHSSIPPHPSSIPLSHSSSIPPHPSSIPSHPSMPSHVSHPSSMPPHPSTLHSSHPSSIPPPPPPPTHRQSHPQSPGISSGMSPHPMQPCHMSIPHGVNHNHGMGQAQSSMMVHPQNMPPLSQTQPVPRPSPGPLTTHQSCHPVPSVSNTMVKSPYSTSRSQPTNGPASYPAMNSPATPTSMGPRSLSPSPQLKRSHSGDPAGSVNGPSVKRSCSATPPNVSSSEFVDSQSLLSGNHLATEQILFEKETLNLKNIVNIKKFTVHEPVMRRVLRHDAYLLFDAIFLSDGKSERIFWPMGVSIYCNSKKLRTYNEHSFVLPETIVHAGDNTIRFDLQNCSCMAGSNGHHKTECQYRDLARTFFRLRVCVIQKTVQPPMNPHYHNQQQSQAPYPPSQPPHLLSHQLQKSGPMNHPAAVHNNSSKPRSKTPLSGAVTSPNPSYHQLSNSNGVIPSMHHSGVSPSSSAIVIGTPEGKPSPATSSNQASPKLSRPRCSSTGSPDEQLLDSDDTNLNFEQYAQLINSPSILPELSTDDVGEIFGL